MILMVKCNVCMMLVVNILHTELLKILQPQEQVFLSPVQAGGSQRKYLILPRFHCRPKKLELQYVFGHIRFLENIICNFQI